MRLHQNVERRLAELRVETGARRESLRVLEEQLAYQLQVAEEAAGRAVVASTPLADRERREAEDDARRVRRQRDETRAQIDELLAEQDQLLERLFAQSNQGEVHS